MKAQADTHYRFKIVVKGIIVDNKQNKLLLLRRSPQDATDAGQWENPGGKLESYENPADTLRREVFEECGLTIGSHKPVYAVRMTPDKPIILIAYLCEAASTDVRLSAEHDDFHWAGRSEYRNMLAKSILKDFDEYGMEQLIWE